MQDDDKEAERYRHNLNEQARLNLLVPVLVTIGLVAAIVAVLLLVLR
jgi:hypothetical protein